MSESSLRRHFECYGPIDSVVIVYDEQGGQRWNKGYGFVSFQTIKSTLLALKNPIKMIEV